MRKKTHGKLVSQTRKRDHRAVQPAGIAQLVFIRKATFTEMGLTAANAVRLIMISAISRRALAPVLHLAEMKPHAGAHPI